MAQRPRRRTGKVRNSRPDGKDGITSGSGKRGWSQHWTGDGDLDGAWQSQQDNLWYAGGVGAMQQWQGLLQEEETTVGNADATQSLLDALAPESNGGNPKVAGGAPSFHGHGRGYNMKSTKPLWFVTDARPLNKNPDGSAEDDEASKGVLTPSQLLGRWVDSQGNAVHVLNTDAFDVKLVARLSKPPRPDIHLAVKPVTLGGGWQCGHSWLDPVWSNPEQLHWVAMDGRVSAWVRPQDDKEGDKGEVSQEEDEKGNDHKEGESTDVPNYEEQEEKKDGDDSKEGEIVEVPEKETKEEAAEEVAAVAGAEAAQVAPTDGA